MKEESNKKQVIPLNKKECKSLGLQPVLQRRRQRQCGFVHVATRVAVVMVAAAASSSSIATAFQSSVPHRLQLVQKQQLNNNNNNNNQNAYCRDGIGVFQGSQIDQQHQSNLRVAFLPHAMVDACVVAEPVVSEQLKKKKKKRTTTTAGSININNKRSSFQRGDVELYIYADDLDSLANYRQKQGAVTAKDNSQSTNTKHQTVRFKGLSTSASANNKKTHLLEHQQQQQQRRPTIENIQSPASTSRFNTNENHYNKPKANRSSTMPGLSAKSDRQIAHQDGISLVEQVTGKKIKETNVDHRKRQKANGEQMYKNSGSVPDSMVQFAEEIHQEDRISRQEEKELGEKTQEAIRLQRLYDNLELKLLREPTDDEWCAAAGKINMEAIRQEMEEGLSAKNKLVTSNLRLVQSVVNTYIRNGLTAQFNAGDMMQEGIMALIRAAEKFEPDRGFAFSTYALYWVRASVKRSQIYQSRIITIPPRLHENHKRLRRIEKDLYRLSSSSSGGGGSRRTAAPTKQEIGAVVGMSEVQVERCFTAMEQKCFSLDQGIVNTKKPLTEMNTGGRSGSSDTLIELVEGNRDDGEYSKLQRVLLREDLISTLHKYLAPEEVELLLLRYGLKEGPAHKFGRQLTIAELSRMVGLKPDKVRRTINRSLKHLSTTGEQEWLEFQREFA